MANAAQPLAETRRVNFYFNPEYPATVRIYVGAEAELQLWVLPRVLICDRLDYFRAAFTGGFLEATRQEITLTKEDPKVFRYVIDWVFNDEIDFDQTTSSDEQRILAIKIYILAKKLGSNEIAEEAIELLWGYCPGEISSDAVICAYEAEVTIEAVRRHLVDEAVHYMFSPEELDTVKWAEVVASNADYGRDVAAELRNHPKIISAECTIDNCVVHTDPYGHQREEMR